MPSFLTEPLTDKPKKLADLVAEHIDNRNSSQADRGFVKPFIAGAIQGLGDVVTDFTSPVGIASLAAGPLGRMRGLSSIGRLMQEARPAEKILDESGRLLTGARGYAGPPGTAAKLTKGTEEAMNIVKELRTPLKTKIQPPRDPSKKGVDF